MNTKQRNKAFKQFFKDHTMNDIKSEVKGELLELGTDDFSFFYGNSELIVCDTHTDEEGVTFVVENLGSGDVLVEY